MIYYLMPAFCASFRNSMFGSQSMLLAFFVLTCPDLLAQGTVSGTVSDAASGNPLVGATISLMGSSGGGLTNQSGQFSFRVAVNPPFSLRITYVGYDSDTVEVSSFAQKVNINLTESSVALDEVVITAAVDERKQQSALTVESMSINAIKETPAANFYEGLGHLKGVDLNSASFGFKVVNTRGFNSTQPVRSLQLIDGIDNQSPGLNFSLGNFLGASELDLESVELVVGASSAYYGPNAFNGVISMKTKNPFIHQGLSASVKLGERNWAEAAVRFAKVFQNAGGKDKFAFKVNLFYLRADDWVADNFDEAYRDTAAVRASPYVGVDNPGGYDAVNRYGDEIFTNADLRGNRIRNPGLGRYYRTGYTEEDLVDYDTDNIKASVALHYKLRPDVELIGSSSYSYGTTVFQGVNRISLKDIQFFQHRLEVRKENQFFLRAYMTHEDAGNSYDPVFTAFTLQNLAQANGSWSRGYDLYWNRNIVSKVKSLPDYPDPCVGCFDFEQQQRVFDENNDQLAAWHEQARAVQDANRFIPGTPEFQAAFDSITSLIISGDGGGTRFYDKSALYHVHGEYIFKPAFGDITIGGNARLYTPVTDGSIFADTNGVKLRNVEYGAYAGIRKKVAADRLILSGTLRMDKNVNFNLLLSPALTGVFAIDENNSFRASLSSAIRNPTLADQYLYYNVGGALLVGNIHGYQNLITIESLNDFIETFDRTLIERFDIEGVEPEKVITGELGYRGLLGDRLYIDAGYYYSRYKDFIGFRLGFDGEIIVGIPAGKVLRISSNATDIVTTQGFSAGLNYYFDGGYAVGGNYSWNKLNTATDDPIIPAFNTPEHKFNVSFSGRDITLRGINHLGFNINYKWVEGFIFEGSPQFTGIVPTYDLLDVQINKLFPKIRSIVKLGASNILNNKVFTVYGGPSIGRLAYISIGTDIGKI